MIQKDLYSSKQAGEKEKKLAIRIKKMVSQVNLMRDLLFEVKADTPLGKTVKTLLNLFFGNEKEGVLDLTVLPYDKLANLIGISKVELLESLEYLQRKGIIIYKPVSKT